VTKVKDKQTEHHRISNHSPIVVHYWADLQSVHGFRCYDNIHV